MKVLVYLVLFLGLVAGAVAGAAVALGHSPDPREWPLIISTCEMNHGELTLTETAPMLSFWRSPELYHVIFRADGRNMQVSARSNIYDLPMTIFESISGGPRRIEIFFSRGFTDKSQYAFRGPEADCGQLWRDYAVRHPELLAKGYF